MAEPLAQLGMYVAAILTIMMWSEVLYKHNAVYRFTEHTLVGLALGNFVVLGIKAIMDNAVTPITLGEWWYIIPILLGFLMFLRLTVNYYWLCRWSIAVFVGVGTFLATRAWIDAMVYQQVVATMVNLADINNFLVFIMVIAVIAHFIFTKEHKGALGYTARFGRWIMLIMFGYMFSSFSMMYFGRLVGRLLEVLRTFGLLP